MMLVGFPLPSLDGCSHTLGIDRLEDKTESDSWEVSAASLWGLGFQHRGLASEATASPPLRDSPHRAEPKSLSHRHGLLGNENESHSHFIYHREQICLRLSKKL